MGLKSNFSVPDIAGLRGVLRHFTAYRGFVSSTDQLYEFDEASVAADDGGLVVRPDNILGPDAGNPGRWLKVNDTGARRTITGPFLVGDASSTPLVWSATDYDTGGLAFSTTEFKVPAGKAGKYMVTVAAEWAANATGRRTLDIRKGGTVQAQDTRDTVGATNKPALSVTAIMDLAVADIVTTEVFQNSGGALTVEIGASVALQRMA